MILFVYALITFLLISLQSQHIFGGDSAEFSLIAHTWSIPHAPGYPLYALLSNLINTAIPIFTIPWKTSLLSSIPTIIASWFLYKIIKELKVRTYIALICSFIYIFLFPVWLYSIVPEVFSLNSMFVIMTTYFFIRFYHTGDKKVLYYIALLIGLSFCHHHIFVLFIPGWIILFRKSYQIHRTKFNLKDKLLLGLVFFFGLSFYLYAPIASYFNPPYDWENAKTLSGFIRLITRSGYGTFKAYSNSTPNFSNQLFDLLGVLIFIIQDFHIFGIIVVLTGLFAYKKRGGIIIKAISLTLLIHIFFIFYSNFTLLSAFVTAMYERFLISLYLILCVFLALGFEKFTEKGHKLVNNYISNSFLIKISRAFFYLFPSILLISIFTTNIKTMRHIPKMTYFEEFAKDIITSVPHNSIYSAGGDNAVFTTDYLRSIQSFPNVYFIIMGRLSNVNYLNSKIKKYPQINLQELKYYSASSLNKFLNKNNLRLFSNNSMTTLPYSIGLVYEYVNNDIVKRYENWKNYANTSTIVWNKIKILTLNSDLRKILYLKAVEEEYIKAYYTYSQLLFLAKDYFQAEKVIKQLLNHSYSNKLQATLVNLLLMQNKCQEASSLVNPMSLNDMSESLDTAGSFFQYYQKCEPNNKNIYSLKNNMLKMKSKIDKLQQQL